MGGFNTWAAVMNLDKKSSLHWQLNVVLVSVVITILVYVGLSVYAGWHDVVTVIAKVGWGGLLIALALSLVNYVMRFGRWQYYLNRLGYTVATWRSWNIYLSGFALTTTPGKAGEAVRSMFLTKHGMPVSASLAAFISERLSDLIAIVLLSCIGLWEYPSARLPVLAAVVLILLVWGMMMYRPIVQKINQLSTERTGKFWTLLQKVMQIVLQAQRCHSPNMLLFTTVISIAAWGMEAWAFHLLLQWCGFDLSWHFAFFVYAISMLAGALSFLPGGLGGTEATMVSLLVLKGVDTHSTLAVTIFIRLTTLWFAVVLGVVALWHERRTA